MSRIPTGAPLSVIVHTRNEEAAIERCLSSAVGWAQEVVVCDMESTDSTCQIAESMGARVIRVPYMESFDGARNLSAEEAVCDWILYLDADEALTYKVRRTIASLVASAPDDVAAFQIPFKTISFGNWIKHSGYWWPSYKSPPLLRKGRFDFSGDVHDPARLRGKLVHVSPESDEDVILHWSHRDLSHYLDKLNRYTDLEVIRDPEAIAIASWQRAAAKLGQTFRWYWDDTRGDLDGKAGFFLGLGSALYECIAELKRIEAGASTALPASAAEFFAIALNASKRARASLPASPCLISSCVPGMYFSQQWGKLSISSFEGWRGFLNWAGEQADKVLEVSSVAHQGAVHMLGGGEVQLLESVRALYEIGVHSSVEVGGLRDDVPLRHIYSLHHEPLVEQLLRDGIPYVLSPIYWDRGELHWIAGKLSPAISRAESLSEVRSAFDALRREAAIRKSDGMFTTRLSPEQERLVLGAAMILPNAECEAEMLAASCGRSIPRVNVVRNAVSMESLIEPLEGLPSEPFVLCVGRVEKNKNQLALVLACAILKIPLVLIGDEVDPHYAQLCRRLGSSSLILMGRQSRSKVAYAMQRASAHCLPSFAETPGLANLEAARLGCPLVCSNRGAEREYFGQHAWYCDPLDLDSITDALKEALASPARNAPKLASWADIAKELQSIYSEVLGSERTR